MTRFTSPVRERGGPESQKNKNHVGEKWIRKTRRIVFSIDDEK